ncbi:lys-63-specific deubiquitinase BRCC36-like [Venturia canescens]|uniref:lys-63-specific deubiquitinase BRCC36-like n=1 Tax=Venturia canescens TaxID=32260 RepID=UPI001C9C536B|nr:lys-63-specific deubiquitinase BRCC36-like [Venturia canescens]
MNVVCFCTVATTSVFVCLLRCSAYFWLLGAFPIVRYCHYKSMESPLEKVELEADVYMACLQHAFTTENFEVMGLLIGNLEHGTANISALINLRRLDKKKDRVEISPEQLLKAATEAERLTAELQRPMRVLGWYHSHPHITVVPSHVDVCTQASYQMMERGFVGLIFSVFNEAKDTKEQEVQLICFQSKGREDFVEIPLEIIGTTEISDRCLRTMTDVPRILVQEEEDTAESCKGHPDILASIHNDAVRTRALIHITDTITKPLIQALETRIEMNKIRAGLLRNRLEEMRQIYSEQCL